MNEVVLAMEALVALVVVSWCVVEHLNWTELLIDCEMNFCVILIVVYIYFHSHNDNIHHVHSQVWTVYHYVWWLKYEVEKKQHSDDWRCFLKNVFWKLLTQGPELEVLVWCYLLNWPWQVDNFHW